MEKLLKRFDELINSIAEARNEVTKEVTSHRKVTGELQLKRKENKEKSEELDKREEGILDAEGTIELDKTNRTTLKEIAKEKDGLVEQRKNFDKHILEQKKEVNKGIEKNIRDAGVNFKEAEALRKRSEKLKKEEETYKDKIAKHIVAGVK